MCSSKHARSQSLDSHLQQARELGLTIGHMAELRLAPLPLHDGQRTDDLYITAHTHKRSIQTQVMWSGCCGWIGCEGRRLTLPSVSRPWLMLMDSFSRVPDAPVRFALSTSMHRSALSPDSTALQSIGVEKWTSISRRPTHAKILLGYIVRHGPPTVRIRRGRRGGTWRARTQPRACRASCCSTWPPRTPAPTSCR